MSKSSELIAENKEKRRKINKEIEAFNSSDKPMDYSIYGHRTIIKDNGEIKIIIEVESPERSFYSREPAEIENEVEKFIKKNLGYKLQVKINKKNIVSEKPRTKQQREDQYEKDIARLFRA